MRTWLYRIALLVALAYIALDYEQHVYSSGYQHGYQQGYQKGLAQPPKVWKS